MLHPYRVAVDDGELPPLPMRSLKPFFIRLCCLFVVSAVVVIGVGVAVRTLETPPAPPPLPRTFDVAELLQLDATKLDALRDHTVVIRGVIRERRHDSFGNAYVELGRGVGYELPIVQCFVADPEVGTLPPGTTSRFRARMIGMSLGVALQADDCTPLEGEGSP